MADDVPDRDDSHFAEEMQNLAYEAEARSSPASPRLERKDLMLALGQMVRPLALELETIKRVMSDHGQLLTALGKTVNAQQSAPVAFESITQQLQRLGAVESANQKLFDALHAELKGYKDNFLFDALQRPFIRDLVSIFDDFTAVRDQVSKRVQDTPGGANGKAPTQGGSDAEFLRQLDGNIENQIHHFQEIFLRMEVVLSTSAPGSPLDKKVHRTVAFEPAATAEEDGQIERSLKPGFSWRERMIRPEEVVVRRWKAEPAAAALPQPGGAPAAALDPAPAAAPASTSNSLTETRPSEKTKAAPEKTKQP